MFKKILFATLLTVATVLTGSAQKFKPSPDFLKGEKQINLIFDYSQVKYKNDSQKELYKNKGRKWVEEWEGARRDYNANSFISNINGELKRININAGEYIEAQYTLIVEVLDCDFSTYAGPATIPAKLKCNVKIVKTSTIEPLTSISLKVAQNPNSVTGTPVDFDRMYLAFGEMGEEVGKKLVKVLYR